MATHFSRWLLLARENAAGYPHFVDSSAIQKGRIVRQIVRSSQEAHFLLCDMTLTDRNTQRHELDTWFNGLSPWDEVEATK